MIISHKYNFVFIHIGKTGGDSVVHTLKPFLGEEDLCLDGTHVHKNFRKHAKGYELKEGFEALGAC